MALLCNIQPTLCLDCGLFDLCMCTQTSLTRAAGAHVHAWMIVVRSHMGLSVKLGTFQKIRLYPSVTMHF